MANVTLLKIPTVDVWMRDYGPTFITRAGQENPRALNDWIFNGWGGKYQAYEQDERVAKEIAALLKIPVFDYQSFSKAAPSRSTAPALVSLRNNAC